MIAVGQKLPNATLYEFMNEESEGCSLGPNAFEVEKLLAGKKIVIFALPGAFTPTCSAKHVPGYVEHCDAIKAKGVDEIWCISVNDPNVMKAWGESQNVGDKVFMAADPYCEFTKAIGAEIDRTERGLGIRSARYTMLVEDNVIKTIKAEKDTANCEISAAENFIKGI